jgi:predicted ester cyclase
MIAEGDKVVWRWRITGTHRGELNGIPPTGKPISITGIVISRFAGGKWAEDYVNWDTLGMLQQIGVVPVLA